MIKLKEKDIFAEKRTVYAFEDKDYVSNTSDSVSVVYFSINHSIDQRFEDITLQERMVKCFTGYLFVQAERCPHSFNK